MLKNIKKSPPVSIDPPPYSFIDSTCVWLLIYDQVSRDKRCPSAGYSCLPAFYLRRNHRSAEYPRLFAIPDTGGFGTSGGC
jgi:hypothetical protein